MYLSAKQHPGSEAIAVVVLRLSYLAKNVGQHMTGKKRAVTRERREAVLPSGPDEVSGELVILELPERVLIERPAEDKDIEIAELTCLKTTDRTSRIDAGTRQGGTQLCFIRDVLGDLGGERFKHVRVKPDLKFVYAIEARIRAGGERLYGRHRTEDRKGQQVCMLARRKTSRRDIGRNLRPLPALYPF